MLIFLADYSRFFWSPFVQYNLFDEPMGNDDTYPSTFSST